MDKSLYRKQLEEIFQAGLAAVEPAEAVSRAVRREGNIGFQKKILARPQGARRGGRLYAAQDRATENAVQNLFLKAYSVRVGERTYLLDDYQRIYVIGAGKACAPMAQAMEAVLGDRLTGGRITVKYEHLAPLEKVEITEAGHPIPDAQGISGTQKILELAEEAGEGDLVFCLISGGGSALFVSPSQGIDLKDKQAATSELLACGASIVEINALRKHLSKVKGGQLARLCAPATVVTLILSDVVADPLDVIASGPTVPDGSSFAGCLEVVERYKLRDRLPATVVRILDEGKAGTIPDTPKAGDPVFERVHNEIVGNNLLAIRAAAAKASELGYQPLILSTRIEGETRDVAGVHAAIFKEVIDTGYPVSRPVCVLSGGETTVTLKGKGKGGRNQEFSLAVALDIEGEEGIFFLSAGTDGTDGPTDAAGAFSDGSTVQCGAFMGLDAGKYLEENDSYHFFDKTGELLRTGPTNTNVMDLRICLIP